jgi:hypothetical protein
MRFHFIEPSDTGNILKLARLASEYPQQATDSLRNRHLVPMIAGREGGPSSDMQRYEG